MLKQETLDDLRIGSDRLRTVSTYRSTPVQAASLELCYDRSSAQLPEEC